jgi:hypothetical protein
MKHATLLLCLMLAVGCGGSDPQQTSGPVSGTVSGASFTATGAVATRVPIDTCTHNGVTVPVLLLEIWLSNSFDTAYMQGHPCDFKAGSRDLLVTIWRYVASGEITPGTYQRQDDSSGGQAVVQTKFDTSCHQQFPNVLSDSGSVTIEANDGTHVVGTLNVSFPGGGRLSGKFDAPVASPLLSACQSLGMSGGTNGPGCSAPVCVP